MRRRFRKLTQKEKEGWWKTKGVKKMKLNKAAAVEVQSSTTTSGVVEGGGSNFFGCYLLTSLSPRHKGHTYVGFTVNPKRRIRQHNGEISSGACKTKKKRPWEMVLCIHGFPTSVAALQFEWAWQHPKESIAVRDAASTFKTLAGLANKIKLALTMLTLPSWHCMDLTVSFFSTKYMKHAAGCPTLPPQIQLHSCSIDELPCYSHTRSHPFHQHDPLYDIHSPSPHTSIDYDSSSLHTQTHNLQDGNGPLEEYSSLPLPVIASPDNQIDPLHHLPCPTEEQNHPFSITLYSDNDSPILKRHTQPSHQLPAHNVTAVNCNNDLTTLTKEYPFPHTKEQVELFQQADPFMSDQFLMPDSVPVTGDGTKREDFTCALVYESPNKVSQSPHRTSTVTNDPSSAEEPVEVVDLLTPSSDCIIVAVTKKRRISHNNPSVIDLTRSPFFLEL